MCTTQDRERRFRAALLCETCLKFPASIVCFANTTEARQSANACANFSGRQIPARQALRTW